MRRCVSRAPGVRILSRLGQRIGDETILGGRREGAYSRRIRRSRDRMQEAHVADIVEVYFILKNDRQALSVQSDS
jgi:hypothetical protein